MQPLSAIPLVLIFIGGVLCAGENVDGCKIVVRVDEALKSFENFKIYVTDEQP